jgi:hypothetical protein
MPDIRDNGKYTSYCTSHERQRKIYYMYRRQREILTMRRIQREVYVMHYRQREVLYMQQRQREINVIQNSTLYTTGYKPSNTLGKYSSCLTDIGMATDKINVGLFLFKTKGIMPLSSQTKIYIQ